MVTYQSNGTVATWEEQDFAVRSASRIFFTASPENAATWPAKDEAILIVSGFFDVPDSEFLPAWGGGYHFCTDFKSEERRPGEFVVFL